MIQCLLIFYWTPFINTDKNKSWQSGLYQALLGSPVQATTPQATVRSIPSAPGFTSTSLNSASHWPLPHMSQMWATTEPDLALGLVSLYQKFATTSRARTPDPQVTRTPNWWLSLTGHRSLIHNVILLLFLLTGSIPDLELDCGVVQTDGLCEKCSWNST